MGCGGENTDVLHRTRPHTSTGDAYQLLLGAMHLLSLLGLPMQANEMLEIVCCLLLDDQRPPPLYHATAITNLVSP